MPSLTKKALVLSSKDSEAVSVGLLMKLSVSLTEMLTFHQAAAITMTDLSRLLAVVVFENHGITVR